MPVTRTYRPEPLTPRLSKPPLPLVVEYPVYQLLPSFETCTAYARAYAASQASCTWLNDCIEPRSTCSHAESTHSLAHRVP